MIDQRCVILHGGAGLLNEEHAIKKLPAMREALQAAWSCLSVENSSEDSAETAVCAALRVLEESPYFNAGYGGYPNKNGVVLLDVGLMRGNGDFVSLMNVRRLKYPSAVALDRLRQGKHSLTVWTRDQMNRIKNSSSEIQAKYGFVKSDAEMIPPFVRQLMKEKQRLEVNASETKEGGTVGCVVRDAAGIICAGTSTGGINKKENGRIGDTPIIGSGVYANNDLCGLSTTGHGESFLRVMFSGFVVGEIRRALRSDRDCFINDPTLLQKILDEEVGNLTTRSKGSGAIIVIPKSGHPAYSYNSEMVSVAIKRGDENEQEDVFIRTGNGRMLRE